MHLNKDVGVRICRTIRRQVELARLGGWWGHVGLVFDVGQPAKSGLTSTAVVWALDPCHDGQAQLVTGSPPVPVEHVVLQESEERFHGGVVGC